MFESVKVFDVKEILEKFTISQCDYHAKALSFWENWPEFVIDQVAETDTQAVSNLSLNAAPVVDDTKNAWHQEESETALPHSDTDTI